MKKYLSIVLGIILTACLVACSNSSKDLVEEQDEEVINNQEVSDTEEQDTSAELGQTDLDANSEQENEERVAVHFMINYLS